MNGRRSVGGAPPWELARDAPGMREAQELPAGVEVRELRRHDDDRGWFTEAYRREWGLPVDPVQWNVVQGRTGTMRGIHVHPRHWDYIVQLSGRSAVGVSDLRPDSPTRGLSASVALEPGDPVAVIVPNGVAHGLLTLEPSTHLYAVSHYWDPDDELPCRWDDPELAIPWPAPAKHLSEQDASAPGAVAVLAQLGWPPL